VRKKGGRCSKSDSNPNRQRQQDWSQWPEPTRFDDLHIDVVGLNRYPFSGRHEAR
jgi:hypothetical protein